MKEPLQILEEVESHIEEFNFWHENTNPPDNFLDFAHATANAAEVFKYAAILYPKFIKVEGVIVFADSYKSENWQSWRQTLEPKQAAAIINHTHIDDFLPCDLDGIKKLEAPLGELVAFFWQMAVNSQFPDEAVRVEFDGDTIYVYQPLT